MRAQELQRARDRDEDGDAFETNAVDEAGRLELGLEVDFGGEKRRRPEAHELAEDVTERKAVQKPQRMNDALVAKILLHLALDGGRGLARTLRLVWTMPLGAAVVPEVKMIWKGASRGDFGCNFEERGGGEAGWSGRRERSAGRVRAARGDEECRRGRVWG